MQPVTFSDNAYVLLLLGMVAVGAHAYSLFRQPDERAGGTSRWRFLASVPIELATTPSRFRLGLLCYLGVFELVYLVLASSSSLVVMAYQVSGRDDLTGALSDSVSPNGTVPILASTAIILLTQIRPVSQAERVLRRFAHRIAHIPDGLRQVKQRVSHHLRTRVADLANPSLAAGDIEAIHALAGARTATRLERSQRVVTWLFESTLGASGSTVWDEEGSEALLQLFESSRAEVLQLNADIVAAASSSGDRTQRNGDDSTDVENPQQGPWQTLLNRSLQLEERLTVLLCLLVINQPDIDTRDDRELEVLVSTTRRHEHNDVSNISIKACALGTIVCLSLLLLYETVETGLRSELRQSPYTARAPLGDFLAERVRDNEGVAARYPLDGLDASERAGLVLDDGLRSDLSEAFEETTLLALTFLMTVFMALSMNRLHVRAVDTGVGRPRAPPGPAAVHYVAIAMTAALATAVMLFVYLFTTHALLPALQRNVDVLSFEILGPFTDFVPPVILRFTAAAAVAATFIVWLDSRVALERTDALARGISPELQFDLAERIRDGADRALRGTALLIACVIASACAAVTMFAIAYATESRTEQLEALGRLMTAFLGFLSFLVVLRHIMPRHPERYLPGSIADHGRDADVERDAPSVDDALDRAAGTRGAAGRGTRPATARDSTRLPAVPHPEAP